MQNQTSLTFFNVSSCNKNKFIQSRDSNKVRMAGMVEAGGYHRVKGSKNTYLKKDLFKMTDFLNISNNLALKKNQL